MKRSNQNGFGMDQKYDQMGFLIDSFESLENKLLERGFEVPKIIVIRTSK